MTLTDEGHYGPKQLNLLKTIWGEGFLSPGGSDEIDEIVKNIDVKNLNILDIGCGCGGAALHLINHHNASFVKGIDVEPLVIQRAKELASKRGLSDKTKFELVSPGPIDFEDESIDMVFSKETFLQNVRTYGAVYSVIFQYKRRFSRLRRVIQYITLFQLKNH